jgi:hypothetical protein
MKRYTIKSWFADRENIPNSLEAEQVHETPLAVKVVYDSGTEMKELWIPKTQIKSTIDLPEVTEKPSDGGECKYSHSPYHDTNCTICNTSVVSEPGYKRQLAAQVAASEPQEMGTCSQCKKPWCEHVDDFCIRCEPDLEQCWMCHGGSLRLIADLDECQVRQLLQCDFCKSVVVK